jgi:hypothetical protein
MELDCEGCAGCCLDWRPIAPADTDLGHERRGPHEPLDGVYNLTPLTSDEVRAFVRAEEAAALTPRLWSAPDRDGVTVDGVPLAAVDGRPAFFVGLRKIRKPVAPFGTEPRWLRACAFLDPATLQCRVHDTDRYPEECASYPGRNLALGAETECERVERSWSGEHLLDDDPEGAPPRLGPEALGSKVFVHPEPDDLAGRVERLAAGEATAADRATFVAAAAAASPGTAEVDAEKYASFRERVLATEGWVDRAVAAWAERAGPGCEPAPDPALAEQVEDDAGAPPTPGWEQG